jgi:hypothetical protein
MAKRIFAGNFNYATAASFGETQKTSEERPEASKIITDWQSSANYFPHSAKSCLPYS